MENIRIIDMHAHIYPPKISQKAVDAISNFYNLGMAGTEGTAEELKGLAIKANAVKIVIHSVATSCRQVTSINNFVAKEGKNDSIFMPFATLHPDMTKEELRAEISRFHTLDMKGVKLHPDFQEFAIDSDRAYKIFEELDGSIPIQLHTGDKRKTFSHPSQMVKAANDFPHIRFIAAHLGGYTEWEDAKLYENANNVYFDSSSSLAFLSSQKANNLISLLGVDRIMFGTDFPMWNYEGELELLYKLNLSKENLQKILFHNANKFMNLGL